MMRRYKCKSCGLQFTNPREVFSDETGPALICPNCGDDDLEDGGACPVCGEFSDSDYDLCEKCVKGARYALSDVRERFIGSEEKPPYAIDDLIRDYGEDL